LIGNFRIPRAEKVVVAFNGDWGVFFPEMTGRECADSGQAVGAMVKVQLQLFCFLQ